MNDPVLWYRQPAREWTEALRSAWSAGEFTGMCDSKPELGSR
ncbi:MAG: hypothetical protein ABSF77_14965 [Spirochaetia bacterium]